MGKKEAFEKIFAKFEKILPHLGNENDGEALNALRSLTNMLKKADLDWHDVLTLMRPQEDAMLEMLKRLLEKETDTLVRLARARATLFYSTKRAAFADVMIGNNILTLPLKSSEFSDWLLGQFFKETQKAPKLSSERDAIRTLSAIARHEGTRCEVSLRTAQADGKLYIDIGDETGRAIEIEPNRWRVIDKPPVNVKFQRSAGMAALPIPEYGGKIKQLRRFAHVSDDQFVLFVCALADALCSARPHPVLNLIGESGSAKTALGKIFRSLTDPNEAPLVTLHRTTRDLFVDANGALVLGFDNVGEIPKQISDALCQLVSGTGHRRRRNYTDLDQIIIGGYRSIVLTAVTNTVTEPDLAERCVTLPLLWVPDEERLLEAEFWKQFELERPKIFAGLLDVVAHGLAQLPHVHVKRPPRLIDFTYWGVACEEAFALPGSFLAALGASAERATEAVIERDLVVNAIAAFMEDREFWDETPTELWHRLKARDPTEARSTESKGWPANPTAFGIALSKSISTLRKIGIAVTRDRSTSRRRTGMVHLRRIKPEEQQGPQATKDAEGSETSEGSEDNRAVAKIFS